MEKCVVTICYANPLRERNKYGVSFEKGTYMNNHKFKFKEHGIMIMQTLGYSLDDFFDKEYLEKDQSYVSTLVDYVVADFNYELNMDAKDINYEYSYKIDAQLEIIDRNNNLPILNPIYEILPEQVGNFIDFCHIKYGRNVCGTGR